MSVCACSFESEAIGSKTWPPRIARSTKGKLDPYWMAWLELYETTWGRDE